MLSVTTAVITRIADIAVSFLSFCTMLVFCIEYSLLCQLRRSVAGHQQGSDALQHQLHLPELHFGRQALGDKVNLVLRLASFHTCQLATALDHLEPFRQKM